MVSRGMNISQVTMGGQHAVAWSKDGRIYCTGMRASIPPTIVDKSMDPKKAKKEAWTFEQCVWDDKQVVSRLGCNATLELHHLPRPHTSSQPDTSPNERNNCSHTAHHA